jgi:hypothetical protein
MSKKKNTLKDLDDFLKQQAAILVSPEKLGDKVVTPVEPIKTSKQLEDIPAEISFKKVIRDLGVLAKQDASFKTNLYDMIIETLEAQASTSAEDKMLINTVLYLKSGDNWKEVIKNYWSSR